jgi:hypothetical protein
MRNYSFSKLSSGLFFTFAIALASCHHEDQIIPEKADEALQSSMRESAIPSTPKKYQLTKHGGSTLTYSEDGTLRKVVYAIGGRDGNELYVQYFYSMNSVTSKQYYKGRLSEVIVYLLDAAGRCYESNHTQYIPLGNNAVQEKESSFSYLYNNKGMLTIRRDKATPDNYTELGYDKDANLVKVSQYAFSLYSMGPALLGETNLSYQPMGGDPILPDLTQVNCEVANLPDPYLHVFGKPTKYLASMITEAGTLGGKYFSYTMNQDGYPTSRKTYNLKGGALLETTNYGYLVTELGIGL